MPDPRLSPATLARALGTWRDDGPLHQGLTARLRLLVMDGRIPVDTVLPSERALAQALDASRTTVSAAYDALRESGHLVSRRGSGTRAQLPGPQMRTPGVLGGEDLIDLNQASLPASSLVPAALRAAADELPHFLSGTGYDMRGLPHLRQALADHYTARGLPTGSEQILVTLGAQHAIHLVAQTLVRRGDRALVESPTYPHAMESLRLAGARLLTTPVHPVDLASEEPGADGWDIGGLEDLLRSARPRLAYLMPQLHNPTGSTMSPATRRRLLAAAAQSETTLVVDETTAPLRLPASGPGAHAGHPSLPDDAAGLPGAPLGAEGPCEEGFGAGGLGAGGLGLGGLGRRPAHVIHLGSASKIFWGGLRVGWIRAESQIIEALLRARPMLDLGTPVVEQLATAHLLGRYPEAIAERSRQLRQGADSLSRLCAEHLPEWSLPTLHGGLAAWVTLPRPASSALALSARDHGVLLPAGARFGADGSAFERFVRLPITVSPERLELAIPALAAAWDALSKGAPPRRRPALNPTLV